MKFAKIRARRAMAWAAMLAVLAGLLLGLLPGVANAFFDDEVVPDGAWAARFSLRQETQDSTVDRASRAAPLINYVIPDDGTRAQVEGRIERSIHRLDLLVTYGFSDSWNLSLNVPYLQLEQDSTLTTASSDPEVQALVAGLQSESLSGFGDVTLTSLHRPVFSDWNAFVWGYGAVLPAGGQESPFVGTETFDLRSPLPSLFGFLHYTRYPGLPGSRFDVRAQATLSVGGNVEVPGGAEQKLVPGNVVSLRMGWSQEIGPVTLGLEGEFFDRRPNTLAGQRLGDRVRARFLRFNLGFGNLAELEQGPLIFPYRLNVQFESLESGSNLPEGDQVTLVLQIYF